VQQTVALFPRAAFRLWFWFWFWESNTLRTGLILRFSYSFSEIRTIFGGVAAAAVCVRAKANADSIGEMQTIAMAIAAADFVMRFDMDKSFLVFNGRPVGIRWLPIQTDLPHFEPTGACARRLMKPPTGCFGS
jgi:hypothetical protein